MRIVDEMVEHIREEIDGAKEYAEKYIESKAIGNTERANAYRQMALDEIRHAEHVRDFAIADVSEMRKVYTFTAEEEASWEHHLKSTMECLGWVKRMIT